MRTALPERHARDERVTWMLKQVQHDAVCKGVLAAGTLLGIARRRAPRAAMEVLRETSVTPEMGIIGDYRGRAKPGARITKRQVSVLRLEDWRLAEEELGCALAWTLRRANLLISGVEVPRRAGVVIALGAEVRLRVTGECDPCRRMDEQRAGLWPALVPDWRGGYLTTVIAGGHVGTGDEVRIESDDAV